MAGYLGTKAVLLSTTAADVVGNAEIGGDLTVGGTVDFGGGDLRFDTSANIYGKADNTGFVSLFGGGAYNSGAGIGVAGSGNASANSVIFTRGAYQESMRIDSSGNVGIGTSSPAGNLDVVTESGALAVNFRGSTDTIVRARQTGDTGFGYFSFGRSSDIFVGGMVYDHNNDNMRFNANNAERMRIDASGDLIVGATSTSFGEKLKVQHSGAGQNCAFFHFASTDARGAVITQHNRSSGGTSGEHYTFLNASSSAVGSISATGSSTSFNTSSDYRLKTDAQPMTGASARVQALKPVNFEWISTGERVDGFLAHEAQEVVPEAVHGTKDAMRDEEYEVTPAVYEDVVIPAVLDEEGNELEAERTEQRLVSEAVMGTRSVPDYQGIDQSKLVPLLTAALQEALTEIADLKARVTALEAV